LTAEKLIYCAETIINLLVQGELKIVTENREEAPIIPLEILQQKYLLNSGIIYNSLN